MGVAGSLLGIKIGEQRKVGGREETRADEGMGPQGGGGGTLTQPWGWGGKGYEAEGGGGRGRLVGRVVGEVVKAEEEVLVLVGEGRPVAGR